MVNEHHGRRGGMGAHMAHFPRNTLVSGKFELWGDHLASLNLSAGWQSTENLNPGGLG